jgi:hypothetical protein
MSTKNDQTPSENGGNLSIEGKIISFTSKYLVSVLIFTIFARIKYKI